MALTIDFLEGSIIFMIIGYLLALIFQIYMLYLNWKQSKVNNQMGDLLAEVKKIRKELNAAKSPVKKKKKKK